MLGADLGEINVWAVRRSEPSVDQWKKDPDTLSYSIIILTLLDDDPPLVFDIVEGASNSQHFVNFFADTGIFFFFL